MKEIYLKMNMHVSNYDVDNYRVKILTEELLDGDVEIDVVVDHYEKGREG